MSVSGMRWKRWLAAGLLALLAAALGACGNGAPRTLTYEGEVYELDESSGEAADTKSLTFVSESGDRIRFEVESFSAVQHGTTGNLLQNRQTFTFELDDGKYEATVDTSDRMVKIDAPNGRTISGNITADGSALPYYDADEIPSLGHSDIVQLAVDFNRISAGRQLSDGGRSFNGSLFLVGMLMLIVGIINVLFPRAMWWLKDGWKFRDAEPSDLALTLGRVSGAVLTIAAFVAIVSSCSG